MAAIGQVAAGLGHDLRNPLAAIRNAVFYVRSKLEGTAKTQDARLMRCLTVIDEEAEHCLRLLADVLDFARAREPRRTACPLGPLVDAVVERVQRPDHIVLDVDVPATLPVPRLDRDMLQRVLVNVLTNAIQAIPDHRPGRIVVCAEEVGDDALCVRVSDDGIGIAAAEQARAFEPLFTTKTQGTGLGLAIAQTLIRRHGGVVELESETGRGTTVRIIVPLREG
jgi:signal transduction histidine kinase